MFHPVFRFSTFTDPLSIVPSVRAQIDRILALPSLLGVSRAASARTSSLSQVIDIDNTTPTRGDREGCDAVNDLQSMHPLVDNPLMPETDHLSLPSPSQIRNQIPVWQPTRHSLRPSDPPSSVINNPGLDRDHPKHHQPAILTIQQRANATDIEELSSPDSKHDAFGDGGNSEVSCLVAGLYTRCSPFDFAGGYHTFVSTWDLAVVDCVLFFSMDCGPWHPRVVYP